VAGDSATTHGARELQLDAREAALNAAQTEVRAQQARASEEANRLEQSLQRVERDAANESSRRAEQNARLAKEHSRLEALQKAFTEEAELLRAGVAEDRKDLRERVARFEAEQSRVRAGLARESSAAELQREEASGAAARRENAVAAREEAAALLVVAERERDAAEVAARALTDAQVFSRRALAAELEESEREAALVRPRCYGSVRNATPTSSSHPPSAPLRFPPRAPSPHRRGATPTKRWRVFSKCSQVPAA
jgi:hypothetical protein